MKRLFPFILLLVFCATLQAAPKARFSGNRVFSSAELEQMLALPGTLDDSNGVAARVRALEDSLVTRDYLFARVDSFRAQTDRKGRPLLRLYLNEGKTARLDTVRWLGDSSVVPQRVTRKAVCAAGTVFRWSNVEFDIDLLLGWFEDSGYPFARVELKSVRADSASGTVTLSLQISSGPPTSIDFVAFPGNKQTHERYLLRESRLTLRKPYDQRRVSAARRRLQRLDFIGRVGRGEIAVNDAGQTGVRIPIEESRSTRLDIAAGYLPASQGRQAVLSGLVNVEFLNLFGGGRRARIHWERPDRRIQAVDVAYREPWILGQPLALRFKFGQRIEDTLYVTRRLAARLEIELPSQVGLWGTVQQEAVFADSASSAQLGLPDSRTTYVEAGLAWDTRDHPTNPRAGAYFSTQAGTGWRHRDRMESGLAAGEFRQHRVGIDADVAQEAVPSWILYAGVHARALQTTEPEVLLPDLYRLGGARTLRGYREEQFTGSRIGWGTVELRYWLGPASRVFLFCDAGSAFREQNGVAKTLTKAGAGFGLRMETGLGVWGVDYGMGEGDRLMTGKLHVSLLSTF